jgi:hypothetical protein
MKIESIHNMQILPVQLINFDDIRHFLSVLFSSCPFRGVLKQQQQQPRQAFLPPSSSHIGGI